MKHQKLFLILGIEAVLLTILTVLSIRMPGMVSSIFAFPFEQIAELLRMISALGPVGNGLALALGLAFSMIPIAFLLKDSQESFSPVEKFACIFTSIVMIIGLYGMLHPDLFLPGEMQGEEAFLSMAKGFLGTCIWSFLILCLVLHFVRTLRKSEMGRLKKIAIYSLGLISMLYIASVFTGNLSVLLQNFPFGHRFADNFWEVLRFFTQSAPSILNIWVCVSFMDLLTLSQSSQSEETKETLQQQEKKVMRACGVSLITSALLQAVFNLLQLRFLSLLSNVNATAELPVVSMIFALLILLISRLMVENKELHDDQDLYI